MWLESARYDESKDNCKRKRGLMKLIIDGKSKYCLLDAKTDLFNGELKCFVGKDVNEIYKVLPLGANGNLNVETRGRHLYLSNGIDNLHFMGKTREDSLLWAEFLCSSMFSNNPSIFNTHSDRYIETSIRNAIAESGKSGIF